MRTLRPLCERLPETRPRAVSDDDRDTGREAARHATLVVELRGIRKSYGPTGGAARRRPDRPRRASTSSSSARPARASRRCCARSTCSRSRARARSRVLGVEYGPGLRRRAQKRGGPLQLRRHVGHGLPAVQPLPAPDGARQHRAAAPLGEADRSARGRRRGRGARCSRSGFSTGPAHYPAAALRRPGSSGSRSPARSASTRR